MRIQLWLPVVVLTALAAGIVAFLVTPPDDSNRVRPDQLGFTQLTSTHLAEAARHAAAYHRELELTDATEAGAATAARRWLVGIAGSAGDSTRLPANVRVRIGDQAARRRAAAFVEFADDLPSSHWRVRTKAAQLAGDRRTGLATVDATVEVSVLQARERSRTQRIPVSLHLKPLGATDTAAAASWRITDLTVGGTRRFVRAFADPVIVRRGAIDVVAPASLRREAVDVAEHASSTMPYLRARYAGLDRATAATIWILEDAAASRSVLGVAGPRTDTGRSDTLGWTDERGEVALDWSNLARAGVGERHAVVRHELAHVALLDLYAKAPPLLLEGVAVGEEVDGAAATPARRIDLAPLEAAFEDGTADVDELLLADPAAPFAQGRDAEGVRVAYLAGYATVAAIESEHGHDALVRLLTQLRDDVSVERAIRNVLRTDPAGLVSEVRTWTQERTGAAASS